MGCEGVDVSGQHSKHSKQTPGWGFVGKASAKNCACAAQTVAALKFLAIKLAAAEIL